MPMAVGSLVSWLAYWENVAPIQPCESPAFSRGSISSMRRTEMA